MAPRRQLNIRLTEEADARLVALLGRMRRKLGVHLSQSDVVAAALATLERDYPPGCDEAARPPDPLPVQPTKRGRPRKKGGDA